MSEWIILIALWMTTGFITFIIAIITDLRGEEYNPDYFENYTFLSFLDFCIAGPIMTVVLVWLILTDKFSMDEKIKKLIWKIANIGKEK